VASRRCARGASQSSTGVIAEERPAEELVNITMVTFNRVNFTRRSIASIGDTAGYPFALTVVDNNSQDGTPSVLREMHSLGLIHHLILNPENRGVAYAANQGWAAGSKAHFMKVDNDIVFMKHGWLARLVEACDRVPDLGAIGYNFETKSYPDQLIGGVRIRPKHRNIGGCAIMIPERAHRLVGYWCEDYFPYGEEDLDMYVRLELLGLRSYYMEDEDVGLHLPEGKASPLVISIGLPGFRSKKSTFDEGDPAYRLEKDRWRALYTGRRGLQRVNEKLYATGLRRLYIEHDAPYLPSLRVRLYVLLRYLLLDPWKRRTIGGRGSR